LILYLCSHTAYNLVQNLFIERAKRLGIDVDISSSGAIMRSFEAITNPTARLVLEVISFKATQRAKYFCAGMLDIAKYGHYALNVPLYTHFTSPIRRYADVLVHRQLESVLQGGGKLRSLTSTSCPNASQWNPNLPWTATPLPRLLNSATCSCYLSNYCPILIFIFVNSKKDSAQLAQEQSTHLYLCVLISDLTQRYGPVIRPAKVVGVLESAFDVLVPEFGIEKRVHVDQMPIDVSARQLMYERDILTVN
jgi:protein SSD1